MLAASVGLGAGSSRAQQLAASTGHQQQDALPQSAMKHAVTMAAVAPSEPPATSGVNRPSLKALRPRVPTTLIFVLARHRPMVMRLSGSAKRAKRQVEVAGLHPAGDELPYVLGHIMWVPSETGASYGDLDEQYLTASYRVYLSEADAKKVFRLYQASSGDLAAVECGDDQLHCFYWSHSGFYGPELRSIC